VLAFFVERHSGGAFQIIFRRPFEVLSAGVFHGKYGVFFFLTVFRECLLLSIFIFFGQPHVYRVERFSEALFRQREFFYWLHLLFC